MAGEISLEKQTEKMASEEEQGLFGTLEEKVHHLLTKFHELKKERDNLAAALEEEREKVIQLEKKLKFLSQDREKVKTRIDQLLHRFRNIDTWSVTRRDLKSRKRMGKERLVEIKVFGQTYTVKTDAEEDYIQEVAKYVNEKMDEVLKKTKSVSTLNVAILTALNIADDLLKEKERRIALLREIEAKSKDLVEKIDIKIGGLGIDKTSIIGWCSPAMFRVARRFIMNNFKQGALSEGLLWIAGHETSSKGFEINTIVRSWKVWWHREGRKGFHRFWYDLPVAGVRKKDGFDTYDCFEIDRNPTEIFKDKESIGKRVGNLH
jgi:cell division protein ZapA